MFSLGGRMASKAVDGAVVEYYRYDGVEPIADYNAAGTMVRFYLNGAGVDERLNVWTYREEDGAYIGMQYLFTDHQGSVIVADGGAVATQTFRYDGLTALAHMCSARLLRCAA